MEPIDIEEMRALQSRLVTRVRERLEATAGLEEARPEVAVRQLERHLAAARVDLQDTEAARDDAVRRYDEEVERKRETVTTLERELQQTQALEDDKTNDRNGRDKGMKRHPPKSTPRGRKDREDDTGDRPPQD